MLYRDFSQFVAVSLRLIHARRAHTSVPHVSKGTRSISFSSNSTARSARQHGATAAPSWYRQCSAEYNVGAACGLCASVARRERCLIARSRGDRDPVTHMWLAAHAARRDVTTVVSPNHLMASQQRTEPSSRARSLEIAYYFK